MDAAAIFGASGGIGRAMVEHFVQGGVRRIYAGSRSGNCGSFESDTAPAVKEFAFDLTNEESIRLAVAYMQGDPPDLIIVATGQLSTDDGKAPERSYRKLDAETMEQIFRVNAIGPAIIAKHALPLFTRDRRCVFAALSARVGSISDNQLGGWHSYRASKAALNMMLRNFAIELRRTHPQAVIASLHPGTVDTALSEPFQGNVPERQLFSSAHSAERLIDVLDGLTPADSGGFFGWDGEPIAY
ncbi:SDR family NAD(P)-dependent oxidoreductase [Altererythrobacter sp. SALINAS58]|nr:SDR family NAD(P)-dependent oxidoreductase [Alteripontixanthobacter muriae]